MESDSGWNAEFHDPVLPHGLVSVSAQTSVFICDTWRRARGYVLGKGRARSSCRAAARKKLLHASISPARCRPSVLLRNVKRTMAGRRARCDVSLSLSAVRPPRKQTMQSARTPVRTWMCVAIMFRPGYRGAATKSESRDSAPLCVTLRASPSFVQTPLLIAVQRISQAALSRSSLVWRPTATH